MGGVRPEKPFDLQGSRAGKRQREESLKRDLEPDSVEEEVSNSE
jgi:hypothetical protein